MAANKNEGFLMLPFGLALDAGVKLQIDDGGIGQPIRSEPVCRRDVSFH